MELSIVNNKWVTLCDNGLDYEFDAVVLTLPVPQIIQLKGITSHLESKKLDFIFISKCVHGHV